ncbi:MULTISPECIES: hypothetical protein [Frankia]|uniref:hypothetical protein n=1 Tax=Frankia TaxID=1854 RepID=UPI001E4EC14A|nr:MULTISPECIES: hypothetical protein [Frankia]
MASRSTSSAGGVVSQRRARVSSVDSTCSRATRLSAAEELMSAAPPPRSAPTTSALEVTSVRRSVEASMRHS